MEERLISKKQLLEKYGISYGALYRWKRKGLIPDEWFIKKATTTGQETFFPEKLITARIEKIQSMKDDVLLDELAKKISGEDKKDATIEVATAYGDRSYKLSDVTEIVLVCNGERIDLTGSVRALAESGKGRAKAEKGSFFADLFRRRH